MQFTEIKNEGLKREYTVKLDAKTIADQMESELRSMGSRLKIPGFRPGHIPLSVLKQRFGKNVMGEVLERAVNQSTQRLMREQNLRPSMHPKVEIVSYEEGSDLDYKMEVELMPEVPAVDFSGIKLEKMVCDIDEKEVDEAIERLTERNRAFTAEKGAKAEKGDQVFIDFKGMMDGVAFEGGTAKNFALTLGSNQFIGGFEDQLIGTKEGSEATVKVTFPENYHKAELAGRPAEFEVKVHEVRKPAEQKADDEFAKKLGFTDMEGLRKAVRDQFSGDYDSASRAQMKKQLFDYLEKECDFTVPAGMLDLEFNSIWSKIEQARKEGDEALLAKSDEELKKEYRKIAERRVKLGILLSDVAAKNKIQVNQDELSRAVMQQAGQYPGQERKVFDFYQKNPQHLEELRGPILEEKAVDFILGKAQIKDRNVSRDELMNDDDEEETTQAEETPKKKAAPARKKKAANE